MALRNGSRLRLGERLGWWWGFEAGSRRARASARLTLTWARSRLVEMGVSPEGGGGRAMAAGRGAGFLSLVGRGFRFYG